MKKTFYSMLFLGSAMFAQKQSYLSVSGGLDIRNAVIGSPPTDNKPALDWITQFDVVGANVHLMFGYESFKAIEYDRIYAGLGYEWPLYGYPFGNEIKTAFIPSVDCSMITRNVNEKYTYNGVNLSEDRKYGFMALGLNLGLQWDLTDSFGVRMNTKIGQRSDLKYIYGVDKIEVANYLSFYFKFNKN